jgi:hypothetical protein
MNSASVLCILFAVAQARFGQEQIPIPAIAAVQGGEPGAAPTIAGAAISDLLAGSNACAKVSFLTVVRLRLICIAPTRRSNTRRTRDRS